MIDTKTKQLLYGVFTWLPFFKAGLGKWWYKNTGGTNSARYCYSVWMRHLIQTHESGLPINRKTVAELGPGDSLGIGLTALLTGSEQYFGLDVLQYGSIEKNIEVFDELVTLIKSKEPIPAESEFKNLKPVLKNYTFPHHILDSELITKMTSSPRIKAIKENIIALKDNPENGPFIKYYVPWHIHNKISYGSVDFLFSQSVLEYIEDLERVLIEMKKWLCPHGLMSHQIDLACMRTASTWDGHWTYSDFEWKLMKGQRPFFINRFPYSMYEQLLEKAGFEIKYTQKSFLESTIKKAQLADRFQNMNTEDLKTKGVYIISKQQSI